MKPDLVENLIFMQKFFGEHGKPIYSDELCGRLLAYAALSGTEDVVIHHALNAAVRVAQATFQITGGEAPLEHKLKYWERAMVELRDHGTDAEWFPAFAERYHIPKTSWPLLTRSFKEYFKYYEGLRFSKSAIQLRKKLDAIRDRPVPQSKPIRDR